MDFFRDGLMNKSQRMRQKMVESYKAAILSGDEARTKGVLCKINTEFESIISEVEQMHRERKLFSGSLKGTPAVKALSGITSRWRPFSNECFEAIRGEGNAGALLMGENRDFPHLVWLEELRGHLEEVRGFGRRRRFS